MTAPDPRLDEIQARLAAATPGRWAVEYDNADDYEAGISYGDYPECIRGPLNVSLTASDLEKPYWQDHKNRVSEVSEMSNEDAEFIANAPADVAFLLAELRKAHEALAAVEEFASLLDAAGSDDEPLYAKGKVSARASAAQLRAAVAAANGDERG